MKKIFLGFFINVFFVSVVFSMDQKDGQPKHDSSYYENKIFPTKMYPWEIVQESEKHQTYQQKHLFFKKMVQLVRDGNLDAIQTLIKESSNIIKVDDFNTFVLDQKGNTFLFYLFSVLVKQDNGYCFKHLPLDQIDQSKKEKIKACLNYLVKNYQLDFKKKNKDSWNVMHAAASCGATDFMEIFLELDPELLEIKHERGKTPLLIAANVGNFDSIDFLLENGANVKTTDSRGWNLFHVFAFANQIECCKLVINGATDDKNNLSVVVELLKQKDKEQRTPALVAFAHKNEDFGKYLLNIDGVN
jgi:hypothetical protein